MVTPHGSKYKLWEILEANDLVASINKVWGKKKRWKGTHKLKET